MSFGDAKVHSYLLLVLAAVQFLAILGAVAKSFSRAETS